VTHVCSRRSASGPLSPSSLCAVPRPRTRRRPCRARGVGPGGAALQGGAGGVGRATVTDVALRNGVVRQTVHDWVRRYANHWPDRVGRPELQAGLVFASDVGCGGGEDRGVAPGAPGVGAAHDPVPSGQGEARAVAGAVVGVSVPGPPTVGRPSSTPTGRLLSELGEVEQRLARLRGTFQWFTTAGAWTTSAVGRSPPLRPVRVGPAGVPHSTAGFAWGLPRSVVWPPLGAGHPLRTRAHVSLTCAPPRQPRRGSLTRWGAGRLLDWAGGKFDAGVLRAGSGPSRSTRLRRRRWHGRLRRR